MNQIVSMILGGGRGVRLYPLTKFRSKPAVPVAGKYRLIDIPISNCLNSGLNRIYVLTQFLSTSLHRHITQAYKFDHFGGGFIEILAAQQTPDNEDWYQGTADAVRQNLQFLQELDVEYVLILSGDQLYRMDFRRMLQTHVQSQADVTIATLPVTREAVGGFGVMRIDDSGRVVDFVEKPTDERVVNRFRTPAAWIDAHGLVSRGREHMASMGVYLFDRDVLVRLLTDFQHTDFGRELFPHAIRNCRVQAHLFDGYWEDIGTIKAFWRANLDLASDDSPFELDVPESVIYTRPRFLPPSRISQATIQNSLVADGCTIARGVTIENSVIGFRCRIGPETIIRNSVVMGADFYEMSTSSAEQHRNGSPDIGIGAGSVIENAVIDKNCRIGHSVRVINSRGIETSDDSQRVCVSKVGRSSCGRRVPVGIPQRGFAFVEGSGLADGGGASFSPAHAAAFEAVVDQRFAG